MWLVVAALILGTASCDCGASHSRSTPDAAPAPAPDVPVAAVDAPTRCPPDRLVWRTDPSMPVTRGRFALAATDELLIALGGHDGEDIRAEVFATTFDTLGFPGEWSERTALPLPLAGLVATTTGASVLTLGGQAEEGTEPRYVADAWIAPMPGLSAWRPGEPLPNARTSHGVVFTGGRLYVVGGWDASLTGSSTVWVADVDASGGIASWRAAPDVFLRVSGASLVTDGRALWIIAGGHNGALVAELGRDGMPGSWRETTFFPRVLLHHAVAVHEGRVWISGGEGLRYETYADVYAAEILDARGELGDWIPATPFPEPRIRHHMVSAAGRLHVVGGRWNEGSDARPDVWSSDCAP